MRLLTIDPGYTESAYIVSQNNSIINFNKIPNEELIKKDFPADIVLIEMISSYGMPVGKEVFETVFWIGRFYEKFIKIGKVELIYRRDVKLHHCNSMKAKDSDIIQALKDKYGDKGTKHQPGFFYGFSKDIWQAFGITSYYWERI